MLISDMDFKKKFSDRVTRCEVVDKNSIALLNFTEFPWKVASVEAVPEKLPVSTYPETTLYGGYNKVSPINKDIPYSLNFFVHGGLYAFTGLGVTTFVFENGKKRKIFVSKNVLFNQIKVAGAFHGYLSFKQQLKIPKILKLMQFPCTDALGYSHLCEGKIDVVLQCTNKIWDIHPLMPIIKAAGGIVSTWDNRDAVNAGSILVSANQSIHNKMLKLLKPVSK